MNLNSKYSKAILISLVFLVSCKSLPVEKQEVYQSELRKIREIYKPYKKLTASFILKGNIENKGFTYAGKLLADFSSGKDVPDCEIIIQDMVFYSPMLKISLANNTLHYKNSLDNHEESLPYEGSEIYFLSKNSIPSEILIPVLTSVFPKSFFIKTRSNQDENSFKILKQFQDYSITMVFENNILKNFDIQKINNSKIEFLFSGNKGENRYFPESIHANFGQNDKLTISFQKINISNESQ